MFRSLVFAIVFAACSGEPQVASKPDLAMGTTSADLGMPPDMTQLYNCGQAFACSIANPESIEACGAMATPTGHQKYKAFYDCLAAQCGKATFDAGVGPCDSTDQCTICVQTGTSPTGMTIMGEDCTDTTTANVMVTDPKCGLCVDELSACYADA